ncbi:VgrG-related protein [Deinococcus navajonensis]|uniref:VgrG-related protein n=1 Tax=Deinococcus navajonensis TaxID=309884 RepID=A0ABV8XRX9_9DEIO
MTRTERNPLEGAVSSLYLNIDGKDMDRALFELIDEISVDSSLQLPDVATVTFRDPMANLVDDEQLKLGSKIKVIAQVQGNKETVFDGEVVEIEPRFTKATQQLRLRAFDRLHRLARGTHTRSFQNVSDMDLVKKLAGEVGMSARTGPSGVVHPYVLQHNQTNLAFLRERTARLGYILYADGTTLYCEPLRGQEPIELTWGDNLLEFMPRLTSMRQTTRTTVRSWDPRQKRAVVGQANKGKGKAQVQEHTQSEQVSQQAFNMEAPETTSALIVRDQGYAAAIAEAQRNQISEHLLEAQGTSAGYPRLTAGNVLKIGNVGRRFSGDYIASSVRHLYRNGEGYSTEFVVSGSRADSLATLIGAAAGHHERPYTPVPGLMIGIVTNNEDPDGQGRVKVKLPALNEEDETDWARVVNIGGGASRGTQVLPEVNDEVLVGFEHDDIHHPYVLGGLWNGRDKPPYSTGQAVKNGKVIKRTFRTRLGHELSYDDPEGNGPPLILLRSSKKHELTLNDDKKQPHMKLRTTAGQQVILTDGSSPSIVIQDKSGNEITINTQGNTIRISSRGRIELKATTGVSIDGGGGNVDIRGVMVNLN